MVTPGPSASNAWQDVSDLVSPFGLTLDAWQELVQQAALGERANGQWMARQVGLSAPRQNGKSIMIVARGLAGVLVFGEKRVVVSAHQQDTARETFDKFEELIEDSPELRRHIAINGIMRALNREHIRFRNGAKIAFKARSMTGGRGLAADCLFLDEAQILNARQWASINSTMSSRPNPQVWLMGTPPEPDNDPFAFARIREQALTGRATQLAYLEWSAEPGDDPAAEETRRKANPAWDIRINHEVVQGEFETYTPDQFARERLGMWPEELNATGVFDLVHWRTLTDSTPARGSVVLAVDTTLDRKLTCIMGVRGAPETTPLAWVVKSGAGVNWVGDVLKVIITGQPDVTTVVVDDKGSSAPLLPEIETALEGTNVQLVTTNYADMTEACAVTYDAIAAAEVRHAGQAELDAAIRGAQKRESEGAFVWSRRKGGPVIAPLVGMSLALWEWKRQNAATYDVLASVL